MNVDQDRSLDLVVTGLRWVGAFGARGTALLFLSSVGDSAHGHQGDGQADGKQDQGPRVALHGVREGRRVPLPARLTDHLRLATGRFLEALAEADCGVPQAFFDPRRDPLRDDRRLGVLLEVANVRGHAAPDLEHLPFYALRYLAHYLNCPFIQLMFCWRVRIVRWGVGSNLLSMLAPAAPSIPPTSRSIPLTIRAETHRERKTFSAQTPVSEKIMRKTSMKTPAAARRPEANPACLPMGAISVLANSICLLASSSSWGLRASMISLMLRSEGSGPSLSSLPNSATRSRPSIPALLSSDPRTTSPCLPFALSYPRLALHNPVDLSGTAILILHQILVSNMS